MGESVITVDSEGRIDYVNQAAAALLGQGYEQVVGRLFPEVAGLVDEADRRSLGDPVRKALSTGGRVSVGRRAVLVPANGAPEHSVEISVSPLHIGRRRGKVGSVLVLHDTSELRGLTRQITYQASHDALTGLVNRREFERRLQEALDRRRPATSTHALCYLDLDRFKVVNDTCGHTAGDNMLREVATLIKDAVRDSDTVGRIGGDEFALLLVGCPLEKARQIADDVCVRSRDYRFVWKDKIFNIGVSIGLVEIGRDAGAHRGHPEFGRFRLLRREETGWRARARLFGARGGECAPQRRDPVAAEAAGRAARQPIRAVLPADRARAGGGVRVRRSRCSCAWRGERPAGGAAAEFIRAAERYRLMPLVDRWVVQAVLVGARARRAEAAPGRSVAINIAGQTLGDANSSSSWSNASTTPAPNPATSASRSPRARWSPTSTMRAASSR